VGREDGNKLTEVANVLVAGGRKGDAIVLLREAEALPNTDLALLTEAWERAGDRGRARAALLRMAPAVTHPSAYARLAAELVRLGDRDSALAFAERVPQDPDQWPADKAGILMCLAIVEIATKHPLLASRSSHFSVETLNETRVRAASSIAPPDPDVWLNTWRSRMSGNEKADHAALLFQLLLDRRRFADAEALANDPTVPSGQFPAMIGLFVDAGQLDIALRLADRLRAYSPLDHEQIATTHASLSAALARVRRDDDADAMYEIARAAAAAPDVRTDDIARDQVDAALITALAARDHAYDALQLAEAVESDDIQFEAFLSILRQVPASSLH
jgi:tetratricopeptide (TPR) repeat protein